MLTNVSFQWPDIHNLCNMQIPDLLIRKYNVPVPRYTSYPTVPLWENNIPSSDDWLKQIKKTFNESNADQGISLYIHLPYCESLCTYCACNTRITKNHHVERPYIESLLKEWDTYLCAFGDMPVIRELHLGGGTPTFFSAENLRYLIEGILSSSRLHSRYTFSFEGHPNNTGYGHLKTLYELGFRRVSYGVQDLDLKVQETINRVQPYENVVRATEDARRLGYDSVNFDLVYGLPFQSQESVRNTVEKVLALRPERIAYYSYAHVPWKRPGQRAYTEEDLPSDSTKRELYELGKMLLTDQGYVDVGMDHFALPGDGLYKACQNKTMHRNFMGYTEAATDLLIGLGTSAISDAGYAYAQNNKKVENYQREIETGKLALEKGHLLSEDDLEIRRKILDISCRGELSWKSDAPDLSVQTELNTMAEEGLIEWSSEGFKVTRLGMAFLRNICSVFDQRMRRKQNSDQPLFSKAI